MKVRKAGPSVQVSESKKLCRSQHAFLANTGNKVQFIALLGSRLVQNGHTVRFAKDDADAYIVSTALEIAHTRPVTIVTFWHCLYTTCNLVWRKCSCCRFLRSGKLCNASGSTSESA